MKKQILILMVAFVVLGTTKLFAQPSGFPENTPYLEPVQLNCIDLDDPLNVVPGHEYTYTVNVPTPEGNKTYHWFVTQNINFIQAGALRNDYAEPANGASPVLASGSLHYNVATADAPSINLTWQSFDLDTDEYVFVVIYVQNTAPGDGCVTDNLKVYRIRPIHSFTLDIANVELGTNGLALEDFEQCVSDVQSAFFNPLLDGVVYDFGRDSLFFIVAAANFTGSYQLSVRFDPTQLPLQAATPDGNLGQIATIYHSNNWSTLNATPIGSFPILNDNVVSFVVENTGSVGPDGLMHYLKIVIEHRSFEATVGPYNYTVQIDGILVDGDGLPLGAPADYGDMVDLGTDPDCVFGYSPFVKEANQVLTMRPTINSVSPLAPGFLPIVD